MKFYLGLLVVYILETIQDSIQTCTRARGVQKVLQLNQEWNRYKLHLVFQYNHH